MKLQDTTVTPTVTTTTGPGYFWPAPPQVCPCCHRCPTCGHTPPNLGVLQNPQYHYSYTFPTVLGT